MPYLDDLRDSIPDFGRDIKVNIQNVLNESTLSEPQRWGVAIACAFASRSPELAKALIEQPRSWG
jgi:alkyl hydroperoxide reductase subunit D